MSGGSFARAGELSSDGAQGRRPLRPCKKCLLRDLAEEDRLELAKYLAAIRPEDRAEEGETERRLAVCRICEKLLDATCAACGCYVEFRAAMKDGRCPKKKW